MNSKPNSKNKSEEVIPTEDVALIRAMVALPKESKILARGVILGLNLSASLFTTGDHNTA